MRFWSVKQHEYPIISQIARNHLTIPPTSAASEREFSAGGNIITKNRNSLAPETVRYCSVSVAGELHHHEKDEDEVGDEGW